MTADRTCGRRGLRADAAVNRQRLLAAARTVFGRDGVDAPLAAVADEAGVGIATLYRRFPDRDGLVAEAFAGAHEALDALLDEVLADEDPWRSFAGLVTGIAELESRDRGFTHLLQSTAIPHGTTDTVRDKGYRTAVEVVRRGQEAGVVRADLTPEDLPVLTFAVAGVLESTRDDAPDAWRRHAALVLEGCRAHDDPAPLPRPVRPVALRRAMLRAARRRTGSSVAPRP